MIRDNHIEEVALQTYPDGWSHEPSRERLARESFIAGANWAHVERDREDKIRNLLIKTLRAISDFPQDYDSLEKMLTELENLTNPPFWTTPPVLELIADLRSTIRTVKERTTHE